MDDSQRQPAPTSRLNVLFVGGFDSTNYVYVELVLEFEARGHTCTVVVENPSDDVNNKMFAAAGIAMTALSDFPTHDLSSYSVAFSGQFIRRPQRDLFDAIARDNVLLISFANLFSAVTQWAPADLVITSGESKFDEFAASGLDYRMVAIGNPQYDPLIRARERWQATRTAEIRRVLIVDQGAFPLGEQGKTQLASCLKGIAQDNPDIAFHIKPRYLPDEEGEHLHKLSNHLYHYLHDVPDNLVLMREPTVLEELVLDYDAMITTWSTAHLDAAVLGMPLMLIGGLDSVDVFDVRLQRVERAYARLRETGCVVGWKEASGGSFSSVSAAYLDREFYDAHAQSAPKVADLVEAIDRTVLSKNLRFAENFALGYREFMSALGTTIQTRVAGSNADRLNSKLYREMNAVIQELAFQDRSLGYVLNMAEVLPFWGISLGEEAGDADVAAALEELRTKAARMKEQFFSGHPGEIASDMFVQDAYFDWLYATGRHAELLTYSGPQVAPESLEFNRGMALVKRWRLFSAARHFVESFSISLTKPVLELRKNKNIATLLAETDRSLPAHAILFFLNAHSKFEALASVDAPLRPGFEAVVYYRMKALSALGRPDEVRELHDRYVAALHSAAVPARRRRPGLLMRMAIGAYRFMLRRYASRIG